MKPLKHTAQIVTVILFALFSMYQVDAQENEFRNIKGFDAISLETDGLLEIIQGEDEYLSISAPKSMLKRITTKVRHGTLHIGYRGIFTNKTARPIFKLGIKTVNKIIVASSGSIESHGILTNDIYIETSSSGKIDLGTLKARNVQMIISSSGCVTIGDAQLFLLDARLTSSGNVSIVGDTEKISIRQDSSGNFLGELLKTKSASIILNSSGSASIWIMDHLDARLSSKGNLKYFGEPATGIRTATGSGDIIGLGLK